MTITATSDANDIIATNYNHPKDGRKIVIQ